MSIVKTKEKKERFQLNLRMPIELQQRIDSTFDAIQSIQNVKKAELIRDAIERGLTSIENDFMNASK